MTKGFTLIELLVVVSIIGVLSIIGFSSYRGVTGKARDSIRKQDLNTLATALEIYFQKNGSFILGNDNCTNTRTSSSFNNTLQPYMANNVMPKDPQSPTQDYCYISDSIGSTYRLFAKLENYPGGTEAGLIYPNPDQFLATNIQYNYSKVSDGLTIAPITGDPTINLAPTTFARVFVTSTKYKGDLKTAGSGVGLGTASSGLDGADKICQSRANTKFLGGTWKAWLSDDTHSPSNRFTPTYYSSSFTGDYQLLDGTVIAHGWSGLTTNDLLNPIKMNEGKTFTDSSVWTDTEYNGTKATDPSGNNVNCQQWQSNTTPTTTPAISGTSGSTSSQWTHGTGGDWCDSLDSLYCFEQDPTVPAPTPSPLIATCVGSPPNAKIGDSVTWTTTVSGGKSPYTYTWSQDVPSQNGSSATTTYATIGQKTARVQVFDSQPVSSNATCSINIVAAPTAIASDPMYRRVFVTSSSYACNFGGLNGGDNICQTVANSKNLQGTWKAWISDTTQAAPANRFSPGYYSSSFTGDYKLLNGTVIAHGWSGLTGGTILNPINFNENLAALTSGSVLTGTNFSGLMANRWDFNTCWNWQTVPSNQHNYKIIVGDLTATNYYWTQFNYAQSSSDTTPPSGKLYCFEQ